MNTPAPLKCDRLECVGDGVGKWRPVLMIFAAGRRKREKEGWQMMLGLTVCSGCKPTLTIADFLLPESFDQVRELVVKGFGKAEPGMDLTELRWLEAKGDMQFDMARIEEVRKGWLR